MVAAAWPGPAPLCNRESAAYAANDAVTDANTGWIDDNGLTPDVKVDHETTTTPPISIAPSALTGDPRQRKSAANKGAAKQAA